MGGPGSGGPLRVAGEKSSRRLMLRLTPTEHAELQELATAQNLSVGQLVRLTALSSLGLAAAVEAGDTTIKEARRGMKQIKRARASKGALRPKGAV